MFRFGLLDKIHFGRRVIREPAGKKEIYISKLVFSRNLSNDRFLDIYIRCFDSEAKLTYALTENFKDSIIGVRVISRVYMKYKTKNGQEVFSYKTPTTLTFIQKLSDGSYRNIKNDTLIHDCIYGALYQLDYQSIPRDRLAELVEEILGIVLGNASRLITETLK